MPNLATTAVSKRRNGAAHGLVLVSGNKLATHLACTRQSVDHLAALGVIHRRPDGMFDQDESRVRVLAHLRSERQRSPRNEADAEHARAKSALLNIRIQEKRRELVKRSDVDTLIDEMAGVVLTALSGLPARASGQDVLLRRRLDRIVQEVRTEIIRNLHADG